MRTERFTAPDGVQLAFHRLGEGPDPVLVVPGGPCRDPRYLGDLAGLASMRPLVVLHPRGAGASDGLSRGWWNDADDLRALAEHLGRAEFDLLAHSAGTRLALAFLARHPGRVRSTVLLTPPASWLTGTPHDGARLVAERGDPDVDAAWESMNGTEPGTDAAFHAVWQRQGPAGYARWTTVEQEHAATGSMRRSAAEAWFRDIPDDAVERIRNARLADLTVVAGDADILCGVAPMAPYARAIGAELVMLSDCGHYPWVEQPRAFLAALARTRMFGAGL